MKPTTNKLNRRWQTLIGVALFGISLGGCARDASITSRITGSTITNSPATAATPSIPTPPLVVISNEDTLVDTGSQGGADSVQTHETSSGSVDISKVSVGGSVQKTRAISTHYKVSGGIYVQ